MAVAVDVGGFWLDGGALVVGVPEVVLGDDVGVPVGGMVVRRAVVWGLGSREGVVLVLSITGLLPGEVF